MKLKHVVNPINKGSSIQHRLMLGNHCIAQGLESFGSDREALLNECFASFVLAKQAQEDFKKQEQKKAQEAQGTLALTPA